MYFLFEVMFFTSFLYALLLVFVAIPNLYSLNYLDLTFISSSILEELQFHKELQSLLQKTHVNSVESCVYRFGRHWNISISET